jgi:KDO2-lipid IV(A) lauroyltransferase
MNNGIGESLKRFEKRKKKKGRIIQLLEYGAVYALLPVVRIIPIRIMHLISSLLGNLLYLLLKERRMIATENLRNALGSEKNGQEIRGIARRSCQSFFLTCLEMIKLQHVFKAEDAPKILRSSSRELETLFQKAKKVHDESGGCIFVAPHIGNWEFLLNVSSMIGIPLVVVARPLNNVYLDRLIYGKRTEGGHVIIPKKNAFFMLQKALQQGKSIAMLPDQSQRQGISANFFGRKATTTPVPAILSIMYRRPIVVTACCHGRNGFDFEGIVSDPLWPGPYESEQEEIFRLTEEMNKKIIRRFPDQYFWIHNRWKTYKNSREFLRPNG